METVGKLVTVLVALVLLGTGLYFAVSYDLRDVPGGASLAAAPVEAVAPPAAAARTANPASSPQVAVNAPGFDQVGTIVYYVQQGVEVPYLFYTERGLTYSKALEFAGESICVSGVESPCPGDVDDLKSEFGSGPVEVQGTVNAESLIVSRMSAAPA